MKANYQLRFRAGELQDGLVRQDHYTDDILISSLFYSGELYLKNNTPLFHGMGILYVTETSPGSELARRIQGKHEGFYAGNFFYDQRTGFSICNYSDPTHQQLGALTVGIVGQGELLHAFSCLPIKSDWSYQPLASNQPVSGGFQSLFGDFSSVKKGVIYLDKENKYTGGLKNDLPHGLGYIENGNGFYDLAFWNLGKRISTRDVLKNLLPDSAMVDQHRMQKLILGKVNKKSADLVYDAHYFGRVNASGWPIGWGLFLCTGELPDTAKFVARGSLIGQFNGANLMEIEEGDYIKAIQGFDRKNAFVIGYRMNERYSYPCFIAADRFIGATTQVKEHYYDGTPPVAVVENEVFKEDTYRYMASLKTSLEALSSRQSITIERVHLSAQVGKSYVASSRGKINLLELKANEIQEGDFVLYNDVFYEISSGKTFNNYVGPNATQAVVTLSGALKNNTAYVLRGYWLSQKFEADPERICPYCQGKPPGKSTYTGVGYTGRSEVNVYANNSGGVNIISTPITTITTVTGDNKSCKYCKGNEVKRRVREKVVRE